MIGKRRNSSWMRICFVVALLATLSRTSQAQPMTYERCIDQTQCKKGLLCLGEAEDLSFGFCDSSIKECFCISPTEDYILCTSSDECPTAEICATNPTSGTALCVGCLVVSEARREFKPAGDTFSTRCPSKTTLPTSTPAPSGTLGRRFDLCSVDSPCADGYLCGTGRVGLSCENGEPSCRCLAAEKLCKRPGDCPDGETCSFDSNYQRSECTSCSFASRQLFQHVNKTGKCPDKDTRQLPKYPPSPNGLSFEECSSDLVCADDRSCGTVKGMPCAQASPFDNCYCSPPEGFKECETSVDCQHGELCTSTKKSGKRKCLSRAVGVGDTEEPLEVFGKEVDAPKLEPGDGMTKDACRFDWDCTGARRCTHMEKQDYGGCAGRRACFCKPPMYELCRSDAQCSRGETCANWFGAEARPHCVSTRVVQVDPDLRAVNDNTSVLSPTVNPAARTDGLNADACRANSDCKKRQDGSIRSCVHDTERSGACRGRRACYCGLLNAKECKASFKCDDGEACSNFKDAVWEKPICRSRASLLMQALPFFEEVEVVVGNTEEPDRLVESPQELENDESTPPSFERGDPEPVKTVGETLNATASLPPPQPSDEGEEGACIAVKSLTGLPAHALVFPLARRSAVLCDVHGNCATPGHMVTWHGHAMMMHTYCAHRRNCTRQRMLVNSPRMRPGLRVFTNTPGFAFTALAARFETDVEEVLLARLVRLGM